MDWAMEIADWKGFAQAPARGRKARQAARPRARQLRRILDRRAERAGPHHGAAGGPRRRRDRHPAERPGPRDELRPGGRRPPARAGRDGEDHPRRHRRGEGRRRLAFRPLDAPCRDRVLQGRRRAHRQGQAHRRDRARQRRRTRSSSTTAASRARDTNRSFDFLELAAGGRAPHPARRPQGRRRGGHRQRDARAGVSQRLRDLRGRGRSRHRRGRRSPATPRSTTSGAASIR